MEALSIIALVCIYLWLELHPFETPPTEAVSYETRLN